MTAASQTALRVVLVVAVSLATLEAVSRAVEWLGPAEQSHSGSQRWMSEAFNTPSDNPLGLPVGMRVPKPRSHSRLHGVDVRLDRWGVRASEDVTARREGEQARVLIVGDSVAFGQGLGATETIAAQLGRRLTRRCGGPVEVFTLACPGWGMHDTLRALSAALEHFELDAVVMLWTLNDLVFDEQGRSEARRPWGTGNSALLRLWSKISRASQGGDPAVTLAEASTATARGRLSAMEPVLKRLDGQCDRVSGGCTVAITPYATQLDPTIAAEVARAWGLATPGALATARLPQRLACEASASHKLPCVDLAVSLAAPDPRARYQRGAKGRLDYVHLNGAGTALIAEHLAARVTLPKARCSTAP